MKKKFYEIFEKYVEIKPNNVPFQLESTLILYCFIDILKEKNHSCCYLELGVEKGGSALFLLLCMDNYDSITLIDQRSSDIFLKARSKIDELRTEQIHYLISKTNDSKTLANLNDKFDLIHIDAGHMYHQVYEDLDLYVPKISDSGIVVIDDFFQPRWPGVTEAVYDYCFSSKNKFSDLVPIVNCFNKLYLCKKRTAFLLKERFTEKFEKLCVNFGDFFIIETYFKKDIHVFFVRGNLLPVSPCVL